MANKSVTLHNDNNDNLYPVSTASIIYTSNGNTVQSELNQLQEAKKYLGYFATPEALRLAHPTGENGQYANVGSTDTIWVWDTDTSDWKNTDNATSTVTSVNGQTGDVVLSGNNINATATVGTASILKSVDAHLTDLYANDTSILNQAKSYTDTKVNNKLKTASSFSENAEIGDYLFEPIEEE